MIINANNNNNNTYYINSSDYLYIIFYILFVFFLSFSAVRAQLPINNDLSSKNSDNSDKYLFPTNKNSVLFGTKINIGGEVGVSLYHADNKDKFAFGSRGHFNNRIYVNSKNGFTLIIDPSLPYPQCDPSVLNDCYKALQDGDAGLIGDYSSKYGINTESSFFITTESKLNEQVDYGCRMNIGVSTGKTRSVSSNAAYMFINMSHGNFELGSVDGPAERMRLDASKIASQSGGIANKWFVYANTEGAYIDAVLNSDIKKSTRHRNVRRPFYVLPMLYSEYTHKSSASWKRRYHNLIGIYAPKISYYSPEFESGFSFGVGYTYDEGYIYNDNLPTYERDEYKNVVSIGATYDKVFDNNVKLKIALTGEQGDYINDMNANYEYYDLLGWNIGGMLSYAGFKLVASFANIYQSGLARSVVIDKDLNKAAPSSTPVKPGDTIYMTLGAGYENGPALISTGYFRSISSPTGRGFDNILNNYSISSHYKLGDKRQQLIPYLSFNYFTTDECFKDDGNDPGYGNNSGYVFTGGIKVKF